PIDLFDGGLGEQSTRLRERLPDHGNRKRRPSHDPERSIGQREDALGVHVVDEDAVQEFMNKIKSLLRRAHTSPSRLILHPAKRRLSNSGPFESRENEGIHEPTSGRGKARPLSWTNHLPIATQVLSLSSGD